MKPVLAILFALSLSACSVLSVNSSKEKAVPIVPNALPFELKGNIQQSADIADQIATIAYTSGVSKQSPESVTLKEQTYNLKMVLGSPSERIDWDDRARVVALNKEITKLESARRQEREDWESKINALATNTSELQRENSGLVWWLWFIGVALALVCFIFPTVGIPLVFWLFRRASNLVAKATTETASHFKGQVSQMVGAIEDYKREAPPEEIQKLKVKLATRMDSDTKTLVSELKSSL